MNSRKTLFFTIILALLIVIGCSFAFIVAKNILHERDISAQNPDFFMHNVTYVQMDVDGNIRQQIVSPNLVHYPDNDVAVFQQPHLLVFNVAQKLWDISADQGKSVAYMDRIYLSGNVNIERLPTPDDLGFTVKTTTLTVYPSSQTADTKEPVTILQNGSIVNAIGAKADLAKGTIDLLSKVKGNYAPGKNN